MKVFLNLKKEIKEVEEEDPDNLDSESDTDDCDSDEENLVIWLCSQKVEGNFD